MAQMAPQDLMALAKVQLSLPSTASAASVPHAYVEELRAHIYLYPNDTLFRVALEPKKGLGSVTCLEDGCDRVPIPLVRRVKTKDGGMREGLGSLSAYRAHIESHPTHKQNRLARLKPAAPARRAPGPSRVTVKKETSVLDALPSSPFSTPKPGPSRVAVKKESSILNVLASSPTGTPKRQLLGSQRSTIPATSSPAIPSAPPPIPKRSSLVRLTPRENVKPEPIEPSIPRKRVASNIENDDVPPKKAKLEERPVPLAQRSNNLLVAKTEALPTVDVEEIRRKISTTQSQISQYEALRDMIERKRKKKTTRDINSLVRYTTELARLRKLKAGYDASLPRAASPIKRTGSKLLAKAESLPKLTFPPFYNPAIGAAKKEGEPSYHLPAVPPSPQNDVVASGSKGPALPIFNSGDEMDVDPVISLNKYLHAIPNIAPVGGDDHFDANGDYHGRGRDTFMGPQAKADDIDKFLIEAGNAELFDGNASIDQALEKLGLQSTHELLPSLDIPLMPHQLLGVAWMVESELKKSLKGGCLADEMGLGKTVQMIATMCKHPSDDPACKTTLILAPLALLVQWRQEISTKTSADWKILIYHGKSIGTLLGSFDAYLWSKGSAKPKKKSDLLKYDVVLTTYQTMALEWPDYEADMKKKEKKARKKPVDDFIASDSDDSGSDRPKKGKGKKERGILFQVDFYRIVLDEAQNVRNKRTSECSALTPAIAKFRPVRC
ncbi:SNF2 family N-terminal domain-containing protein [Mycena crocata]|nr:SNF2 family N-terminal domain-containing protein [Mycena crocata]